MLPRLAAPILLVLAAAAGCVEMPADDVDTSSADASSAASGLPVTDTLEGSILISAATPVRTLNYGGEYSAPVTVAPNATGYVVELEWDAAGPASETLSLWIRIAGQGSLPPDDPMDLVNLPEPVAKVSGPSPLRIALPVDDAFAPGDYEVLVRADDAPVGAALEQPFTLHVTAFEDIPFDDAFTMLGA